MTGLVANTCRHKSSEIFTNSTHKDIHSHHKRRLHRTACEAPDRGSLFSISMKISIEIEVSPDEVGLATELVATLRSLTSHVSVKQVSEAPLLHT